MKTYASGLQTVLPAASAPVSAVQFWAADAYPCPLAHPTEAQMIPDPMSVSASGNGTSVFTGGLGLQVEEKRTDVRGVPPRGRPV